MWHRCSILHFSIIRFFSLTAAIAKIQVDIMAVFIRPPALFKNYDECDTSYTAPSIEPAEPTWGYTQPKDTVTPDRRELVPFRFLDLPPELRNHIYRELLALPAASSDRGCYPQILAASKQINDEATGLLYEDNFIHVHILPDGVFARNTRCGSYVPARRRHHKRHDDGLRHLVWPAFIRKARFVSVDATDKVKEWQEAFSSPHPDRIRRSVHEVCVSNVLWSLCIELNDGQRRLLHVKHVTKGNYVSSPAYAMRMYTQGGIPNRIQSAEAGDEWARRMASKVSAGCWKTHLIVIWICLALLWRTVYAHSSTLYLLLFPSLVLRILVDHLVEWTLDADRFTTGRHTAIFLRSFVSELRHGLHCLDVRSLPDDVLTGINEILHLEVEVELATKDKRRRNVAVRAAGDLDRIFRRLQASEQIPTLLG
ncbi:unnamed protein product [Zymoseptoria tritici ST99CH_1E4]|uniref:F-box domain-containing protein n=1 Tax=Zymoseptoria tritici ST99CH_1E4 TaxID=1276532 RepID=A0A2H1GCU8_ZYMTR|nr:unnamed protein product [Zymoseptoria tritici ST99CH_1E4]